MGCGARWTAIARADAGGSVDLGAGTGLGGDAEGDTLVNVEDVLGSKHNDVLTGDAKDNILSGNNGDDELNGEDGDDTLEGGKGAADFLHVTTDHAWVGLAHGRGLSGATKVINGGGIEAFVYGSETVDGYMRLCHGRKCTRIERGCNR